MSVFDQSFNNRNADSDLKTDRRTVEQKLYRFIFIVRFKPSANAQGKPERNEYQCERCSKGRFHANDIHHKSLHESIQG